MKSVLALTLLAALGAASTALQSDDLERDVVRIAQSFREAEDVEGLALAVDIGGELLVSEGWGTTGSEPVEPDSAFRAGSLTGTFVSAAVLELVDAGKVELDANVGKYLTELEGWEEELTVERLLSHTSGLVDWGALVESGEAPASAELLPRLKELPLGFTPGSCFQASDTNVLLLGWILERTYESTVPEVLARRFFEPLGMVGTLYCDDGPPLREVADAAREIGGELVEGGGEVPAFSGRQLCTTAPDLIRWQRALLEGRFTKRRTYDRMTRPVRLTDGQATGVGLGVDVFRLGNETGIAYGGTLAGGRVHVAHYPSLDLTIAVLAGEEDAPVRELARRVARRAFELPAPELQDLPLTIEERARYLGGYYVGCTRLDIGQEGSRLTFERTDGPSYVLLYQGEHRFVAREDEEVRLEFELEAGRATLFRLDERGVETVARRMDQG